MENKYKKATHQCYQRHTHTHDKPKLELAALPTPLSNTPINSILNNWLQNFHIFAVNHSLLTSLDESKHLLI